MTGEGYADFDGSQTWYRIDGDLHGADGPAPLVVLHGGPGATHDYLTPLAELARDGRAVVLYDQLGNGRSTHHPDRGA
ncbi:MAG: alpha/beta fold hydrolase, partial [Actinomycetes bacterium]